MAIGGLLAWRNWCFERATIEPLADSPFSEWQGKDGIGDLLTPQLGVGAQSEGTDDFAGFRIMFDQPLPVDLVALLDHNITERGSAGDFGIELFNGGTPVYQPSAFPFVQFPTGETYPSHLIFRVPVDPRPLVDELIVYVRESRCGTVDPWTGTLIQEPFRLGAVWAGPGFWLDDGFDARWGNLVLERPRVTRSIGGQVWSEPEPRFRQLSIALTGMSEQEAYGDLGSDMTGTAADPTVLSIQDMLAWAAASRPVIAAPRLSESSRVYRTGLYGGLLDLSEIVAQNGPDSGGGGVHFAWNGRLEEWL